MEKFLFFFDLRTGVLAYAVLNLIYSCLAAIIHFGLSVYTEDPEVGEEQTFYLAGNFVNIFLTTCLAYGAHKESRVFLLPYLILGCLVFAIATLLCFILIAVTPLALILLLILAFAWYVWYAVLCLYKLLDPLNPNYAPQQLPSTVVYVEDAKPPAYYENNGADAV